jgi:hypothetical protein
MNNTYDFNNEGFGAGVGAAVGARVFLNKTFNDNQFIKITFFAFFIIKTVIFARILKTVQL